MKLFGGNKNAKHTGHYQNRDLHQTQPGWDKLEEPRDDNGYEYTDVTPAPEEPYEASPAPGPESAGFGGYVEPEDAGYTGGGYTGGTGGYGGSGDGGNNDDGFDDEDGFEDEEEVGRRFPTWAKILIVVVSVLAILFTAAFIWLKTASLPDQTQTLNPAGNTGSQTGDDADSGKDDNNEPDQEDGSGEAVTPPDDGGDQVDDEPKTGRNKNVYTCVIAGKDKGGANTDVLMVACLDIEKYTLNVVSLPRDTYCNTTYKNHRINSVYAVGGADALMKHIGDFMGYKPDFYAVVDLNAFIKLVNAVGGVDYYVPRNMNYDDDYQNLHIHFTKGMTHMDGQAAMEYCRYRAGYSDADIGRIDAQHDFLKEAAKQILQKKDSLPLTSIFDIVLNDVKTDLTLENCTALAKELLKMDAENVNFYTLPANYNDVVHGSGYVTVYINDWVEMLNDHFNPFYEEITTANLNVAGRDSKGNLYSTTGVLN